MMKMEQELHDVGLDLEEPLGVIGITYEQGLPYIAIRHIVGLYPHTPKPYDLAIRVRMDDDPERILLATVYKRHWCEESQGYTRQTEHHIVFRLPSDARIVDGDTQSVTYGSRGLSVIFTQYRRDLMGIRVGRILGSPDKTLIKRVVTFGH